MINTQKNEIKTLFDGTADPLTLDGGGYSHCVPSFRNPGIGSMVSSARSFRKIPHLDVWAVPAVSSDWLILHSINFAFRSSFLNSTFLIFFPR